MPWRIQARISDDNGKQSYIYGRMPENSIVDIHTVQRSDGKIVTIYYFSTVQKFEQHIAVTIWDPDKINSSSE